MKSFFCLRASFANFSVRLVCVVTLKKTQRRFIIREKNTLKDIMKVCKFKLFKMLDDSAHAMTKIGDG